MQGLSSMVLSGPAANALASAESACPSFSYSDLGRVFVLRIYKFHLRSLNSSGSCLPLRTLMEALAKCPALVVMLRPMSRNSGENRPIGPIHRARITNATWGLYRSRDFLRGVGDKSRPKIAQGVF
jgi:hypothetical protein